MSSTSTTQLNARLWVKKSGECVPIRSMSVPQMMKCAKSLIKRTDIIRRNEITAIDAMLYELDYQSSLTDKMQASMDEAKRQIATMTDTEILVHCAPAWKFLCEQLTERGATPPNPTDD